MLEFILAAWYNNTGTMIGGGVLVGLIAVGGVLGLTGKKASAEEIGARYDAIVLQDYAIQYKEIGTGDEDVREAINDGDFMKERSWVVYADDDPTPGDNLKERDNLKEHGYEFAVYVESERDDRSWMGIYFPSEGNEVDCEVVDLIEDEDQQEWFVSTDSSALRKNMEDGEKISVPFKSFQYSTSVMLTDEAEIDEAMEGLDDSQIFHISDECHDGISKFTGTIMLGGIESAVVVIGTTVPAVGWMLLAVLFSRRRR